MNAVILITLFVIFTVFFIFLCMRTKYICKNGVCYTVDSNKHSESFVVLNNIDNDIKNLLIRVLNEADCPHSVKAKIPYAITNTTISENVYKIMGSTSFTVDKKDVYLCLKNDKGEYYDKNLMLMVTIHEYAHVLCNSQDHTNEFKQINKYLLEKSIKYGMYKPINFEKNNREYCGMVLKHNPV